jgi:hypothetical protein
MGRSVLRPYKRRIGAATDKSRFLAPLGMTILFLGVMSAHWSQLSERN